ncbi:MAG: hypothetical protein ACLP62_10420 [Acidimicrobiales bacterium]
MPHPDTESQSGPGGGPVDEGSGDRVGRDSRLARLKRQISQLIVVIREGDEGMVQDAVLELSRRRRVFAPLALIVSAIVLLFEGLRLLVSNWRLTLIQVLPAMWIWLAMFDLKVHALRGRSFTVLRGPVLIPLVLAIMAISVASYYLNGVFAFAITKPGEPKILPAFGEAWSHVRTILLWGCLIGFLLAWSTLIVTRWGRWWFVLSLSIVVGLMMVTYVAVPSRMVGVKAARSKRDALTATVVGGAVGAIICTPGYAMGRIGILMLGSHALFIPGIVVLSLGMTLQAGTTGAVKAVKVSAKLVAGRDPNTPADAPAPTGEVPGSTDRGTGVP